MSNNSFGRQSSNSASARALDTRRGFYYSLLAVAVAIVLGLILWWSSNSSPSPSESRPFLVTVSPSQFQGTPVSAKVPDLDAVFGDRIRLLKIHLSDGAHPAAVLEVNDKSPSSYRVGETVEPDWRIAEIQRGYVLLHSPRGTLKLTSGNEAAPADSPSESETVFLGLARRADGYVVGDTVNSDLTRAGLISGDIIYRVNGQPVSTPDQDLREFYAYDYRKSATLDVRRGDKALHVYLTLGE